MPRQLVLLQGPVTLSIVAYDVHAGEDIFLTYSWARREGPGIERTGQGPPYMPLIGGQGQESTVQPFGLRLGTWLLREEMRNAELQDAEKELKKVETERKPPADQLVLRRTVEDLKKRGENGIPPAIRAHDSVFQERYPDHQMIGQQGCGDLTMNSWKVAYVNGLLGQEESGRILPQLVCLPSEPVEQRIYACLIKWKPAETGGRSRVSIEEVRFRRPSMVGEPNELVWIRYGEQWLPRGDAIEFAVSSQQVLRNGVVPVVTTCHQFGDVRHLLQMPNLNPNGPLYPGERPESGPGFQPRKYFGKPQFGDIWLGEAAFLEDQSRNLLRGALAGPVLLDFPEGADERQVRGALELAHYLECRSTVTALSPGEWRFVECTPQRTMIDVYLRRNTYNWTMLGLTPDNRQILALACTSKRDVAGYRLEEAAAILQQAGAANALLIDEGADVFQSARGDQQDWREIVTRLRSRLRATFIFAQTKKAPTQPKKNLVSGEVL